MYQLLTITLSTLLIIGSAQAATKKKVRHSKGYSCNFEVNYSGDTSQTYSCESKSLRKARSMMFRRARATDGLPGACHPVLYPSNRCNG